MKKRKKLTNCLLLLAGVPASIGLAIGLDMVVAGSVYHPLTYLYSASSWLGCKKSPNCINIKTSAFQSPTSGKKGIVVTTQHKASEVGLEILKQGGNAIDAAVGVGYALAVTDPCCGNIGGGGFMVIHHANSKSTFINFREKAPLAATKGMYLNKQGKVNSELSTRGYLAVAVPGTVKGLDQALSQYGTFTREQVMAPAIKLASEGFVLQQGDTQVLDAGTKKFKAQPNVADVFLKESKTPYQEGDRLVQKDLADTLKLIAAAGPDAFYKGAIAKTIVKASQENGGIITTGDFANYTVSQSQPLRCNYRGYEVVTTPPPGGGTTLCQMLNILEGYQLKQLGWHSTASLHRMFSAMLYAYADRNKFLGDPAFAKNPVERLLSKNYAAQIRNKIPRRGATSPGPLYWDTRAPEGTNTTHYSIQDRYGNAVAVTYTVNSYFGAGVIAGDSGFFLNNEMDDFTAKPGSANNFGLVQGNANVIEPGKRPLSSMTPTVITKNGKVLLVTGSPGGSTIPTTVLQVITNVIDYGMNISEAVDAPRFHYQGLPNVVITEPYALKPNVVQELWEMGYKVIPFFSWGAAESIWVNPQKSLLYGSNDRRKPAGKAIAY